MIYFLAFMVDSPDTLAALQARLQKLCPLAGSRAHEELSGRLDFLRRVFGAKVLYEAERGFAGPFVVVVTGGTNVGKSEVFNALAGARVSAPDPRAGMTRRPAVYADPDREADVCDPRFLPGYDRRRLEDPAVLNEPCGQNLLFHYALGPAGGVLLADSPDVDSHRTENLVRADHLLAASDVVVFVTSPSKYNDEACVTFLRRALDLGRIVTVVFNFLGDEREKVLADFRASVPGAAGLEITAIDRFPIGEPVFPRMSAGLAALRERLLRPAVPRAQLARSALAFVQRETGTLLQTILRDLESLEGIRHRAAEGAALARRGFESELRSEKDPEVEAVINEVLNHFRVPVIDDILNAPSRAISWVFRTIQGREPANLEAEGLARRRKDRQRKKLGEVVDGLRAGILRSMTEMASDPLIVSVLRRASSGPLGSASEKEVESAWDEMEPRLKAWRDGMREEMIEKIRKSPNLRYFLQGSKTVLQVGAGVLTAVLLGAPIGVDIMAGSAVAKLTQLLLETFGNAYFEDKRSACLRLQLERFDALAKRFVFDPLDAAFPPRPDRDEIEGLRRDIEGLRL